MRKLARNFLLLVGCALLAASSVGAQLDVTVVSGPECDLWRIDCREGCPPAWVQFFVSISPVCWGVGVSNDIGNCGCAIHVGYDFSTRCVLSGNFCGYIEVTP